MMLTSFWWDDQREPGPSGDWTEANGIFLEITQGANSLCNAALVVQNKCSLPIMGFVIYCQMERWRWFRMCHDAGAWSADAKPEGNFGLQHSGRRTARTDHPRASVSQFSTNVFAYLEFSQTRQQTLAGM